MVNNKLLASILVAGIIAMLAGFIAKKSTETEPLAKDAYPIAVASAATSAAPEKVVPLKDLLPKADAANGQKITAVCSSCHVFKQGGGNGMGPNLFGVVGRARGTAAGYAYSDAMKAKGGNWTPDNLNEFLSGPQTAVPGTKMTFMGLPKPEDRADVIKYLQSLK
jgi:cytochrome c